MSILETKLKNLTVKELREEIRKINKEFKGYSTMKKNDLITIMLKNNKSFLHLVKEKTNEKKEKSNDKKIFKKNETFTPKLKEQISRTRRNLKLETRQLLNSQSEVGTGKGAYESPEEKKRYAEYVKKNFPNIKKKGPSRLMY
tara:strand:+ start:313 stop:741 length:429 start_codon:yes stop_codon:yes gene_type:complete